MDQERGLADGTKVTLEFDDGDTETLYAAAIPEAVADAVEFGAEAERARTRAFLLS